MKQEFGPFGVIDTLTADELHESLGHHFNEAVREQYRGEKLMRMPISRVTAAGAAFTLVSQQGDSPPGPEQGYIWRIQRLMVASNSLTDAAKYVLYVGSDSTATDSAHLIEGFGGGGQTVNTGFRPGNKSEWIWPGEFVYPTLTGATTNNVYTLTGIVAEVPMEMQGKLI